MITALDVADEFVRLSLQDQRPLTNMKVQKLTYIAYGYWLGFTNYQLFQDSVEAWRYGPVIPTLYYHLAKYGANFIQEAIITNRANAISPGSEESELIAIVYDKYKDLSAGQLSYLTHLPNTPWSKTWNIMRERKGTISPEEVRDYYQQVMLAPDNEQTSV